MEQGDILTDESTSDDVDEVTDEELRVRCIQSVQKYETLKEELQKVKSDKIRIEEKLKHNSSLINAYAHTIHCWDGGEQDEKRSFLQKPFYDVENNQSNSLLHTIMIATAIVPFEVLTSKPEKAQKIVNLLNNISSDSDDGNLEDVIKGAEIGIMNEFKNRCNESMHFAPQMFSTTYSSVDGFLHTSDTMEMYSFIEKILSGELQIKPKECNRFFIMAECTLKSELMNISNSSLHEYYNSDLVKMIIDAINVLININQYRIQMWDMIIDSNVLDCVMEIFRLDSIHDEVLQSCSSLFLELANTDDATEHKAEKAVVFQKWFSSYGTLSVFIEVTNYLLRSFIVLDVLNQGGFQTCLNMLGVLWNLSRTEILQDNLQTLLAINGYRHIVMDLSNAIVESYGATSYFEIKKGLLKLMSNLSSIDEFMVVFTESKALVSNIITDLNSYDLFFDGSMCLICFFNTPLMKVEDVLCFTCALIHNVISSEIEQDCANSIQLLSTMMVGNDINVNLYNTFNKCLDKLFLETNFNGDELRDAIQNQHCKNIQQIIQSNQSTALLNEACTYILNAYNIKLTNQERSDN
ncbi:DNA-directed RNA polymerase subunit beta' [Acrasis kona]|uniref:DNA-directed RNA polymerase subunit beta n=1 Tax=Acrasis kona TaxID=1008807 RepID=A0AAW2YYE3_9EUKA